ncbi:MAG: hypothetical protein A2902_04540 [Elusimicrobia bacterium RIFCSPLOWO2_01_FULL_64_13]|nr:MAG: hypothetical protein A2902_04540 [Elusimicrobia bacterium RIFCSPLOWO2_01_FULL_64_13]
MRREITRLKDQSLTEGDFRQFRLQRGIYGQKQKPDVQMVRVKIPWGRLTSAQLLALADIADRFAGADRKGIAHVTTRQDIQYHFVSLDQAPDCMERLAECGLTTREACGNTVRNVTADPLAGVARDEVFDVSPYAEAAARFCLRHPVSQALARKFKISFSGSAADRGLNPMHDLGFLAAVRTEGGKAGRGFVTTVGGGLGPTPKTAQVLEEFTPVEDFLRTTHAVLFVFNRDWDYGRKNRNMARIKFLIEKIGIDEFKRRVFAERHRLRSESYPEIPDYSEAPPPAPSVSSPPGPDSAEYRRWRSTNVLAQKQGGYSIALLHLFLGDIRSDQLRALAGAAEKFSNGLVRTTVQQNFVLRWVKNEALPALYGELAKAGLAVPSAERLADITSCPGADTCQLGITSSRGLAGALVKFLREKRPNDADLADLKIKVSGCPNSCGQHHIADIGFYGGARTVGGKQVPTYTMLLGGHIGAEGSGYGKHFLRVPAKKIPAVVDKLLDLYQAGKRPGEIFRSFVARTGFDALKRELEPLTDLPESPDSDFFSDWGGTGTFTISTGPGECAA